MLGRFVVPAARLSEFEDVLLRLRVPAGIEIAMGRVRLTGRQM